MKKPRSTSMFDALQEVLQQYLDGTGQTEEKSRKDLDELTKEIH